MKNFYYLVGMFCLVSLHSNSQIYIGGTNARFDIVTDINGQNRYPQVVSARNEMTLKAFKLLINTSANTYYVHTNQKLAAEHGLRFLTQMDNVTRKKIVS